MPGVGQRPIIAGGCALSAPPAALGKVLGAIETISSNPVPQVDAEDAPAEDGPSAGALQRLAGIWRGLHNAARAEHRFRGFLGDDHVALLRANLSQRLGHGDESTTPMVDAFLRAADRLLAPPAVPGALAAFTLATVVSAKRRTDPQWMRGHCHQMIRLAHLVETGRRFDAISVFHRIAPLVGFAWVRKQCLIAPCRIGGGIEIDAVEGTTFVEIKGDIFSKTRGRVLAEMLRLPDPAHPIPEPIKVPEDDAGAPLIPIPSTVKFANQMLRYQRLIQEGKGERFELHLTSRAEVPQTLVDAFLDFFEGRARIIRYRDMFEATGQELVRSAAATL